MNKLLKGSIAGAVGVALLLGGGGTLALWNASTSIQAGTIRAGTLTVTDSGTAGVWTSAVGTVNKIADFRIVPGDVLTYTKMMNIAATGDNLTATLTLDPTAIVATTPGTISAPTADDKLASFLTGSATVTATGTGITPITGTQNFTVAPTSVGTSASVTVVVKITFPKSSTAGFENGALAGSVDLSKMAVLVTQN